MREIKVNGGGIVEGDIVKIMREDPPTDAEDQKSRVCTLARKLKIDEAARLVADCPNYIWASADCCVSYKGIEISISGFSGFYTCRVKAISSDIVLYEASGYGKYILSFRPGPWVQRLLARADELRAEMEVQQKIDEAANVEADAALFQEIDF